MTPLLATKLMPPRRVRGLIDRPRLARQADEVAAHLLTVVKAPPGFGKTTLARIWADRLALAGGRVAWLTLDPDDDEPTRFLYYLAGSLARAAPPVGAATLALLAEQPRTDAEHLAALLINDLAQAADEVFACLDDYHLVTQAAVHDAVRFLLKHAPSNFHLILLTRAEPPLPLALMRAREEVFEVNAPTLRFDLDETGHFLAKAHAGRIAPEDVAALHASTEGWVAALRLASLSLGGQRGSPARLVRALSGSSRPIGALLTELLDGLPAEDVDFLLAVAVAERLCAGLAEALTGRPDAQAVLERFEKQQLFLTALDDEGRWFALHQLLREHLQRRLQSADSGRIAALHRRACDWFAGRGLWTDAVKHALAAGDAERALGWIEQCAMSLVEKGDLFTLVNWQRQLQAALLRSPPRLRLALAWAFGLTMGWQEALDYADGVEEDAVGDASIHWECEALRAMVGGLTDQGIRSRALGEACLASGALGPWVTNVVWNVVRFGQLQSAAWEDLYATAATRAAGDSGARPVFTETYRLSLLGIAELRQANLDAAATILDDAMAVAAADTESGAVPRALPAALLARVRYEQGRTDEAERLLRERMEAATAAGFLDCVMAAHVVAARLAAAGGDEARARRLLEQAEGIGETRNWPRLVAEVLRERAALYLQAGREIEAAACAGRLAKLAAGAATAGTDAIADIRRDAAVAQAWVDLARGNPGAAAASLRPAWQEALATRQFLPGLTVGAALARAEAATGDIDAAFAVLARTVAIARAGGCVRSLIDAGRPFAELLARWLADPRGRSDPGLAAFAERLTTRPATATPTGRRELLSARERHIVELIAAGKSNKEIAAALGIAPETVKAYLKNVFAKLEVDSRAQAAVRAQSLGLLRAGGSA